jgi:multisubunit Na+/H+ antiporter MnhG subunit
MQTLLISSSLIAGLFVVVSAAIGWFRFGDALKGNSKHRNRLRTSSLKAWIFIGILILFWGLFIEFFPSPVMWIVPAVFGPVFLYGLRKVFADQGGNVSLYEVPERATQLNGLEEP